MDQGKVCGIAIGLLGGWMLFGNWEVVASGFQQGLSLPEIFNMAFSMRLLASLAAFVAGVAALTELRGGDWFAGIASFAMGVLTLGMIAMGQDKALWQDEIIYLFILTTLFLGILVARGQAFSEAALADELAAIAEENGQATPSGPS